MIKLTQAELDEKLRLHKLWFEGKDEGERLEGEYDLSGLNMRGCDMSYCDMRGCDMSYCNMTGCNMRDCDMRGCDMSYCNMRDCNMNYAKNIPYIPLACPDTGSFIGWKKVNKRIIRLEVPEDAKRSSATTNKCRCDKARVIAIENIDGTDSGLMEIVNDNYAKCVYRVGEMVYPDSFDDCRWNECSHGIHFFINRQDAVNW